MVSKTQKAIEDFLAAHRGLVLVGIAVGVGLLFSAYLRISLINPKNSDDAAVVLQAQDILQGNILLHGWVSAPDSGFTTFLLLHVLCGLLIRHLATLMYVVPPISYVLLAGACAAITWLGCDAQHRLLSTTLVVVVVAFPALLSGIDTGPPVHTGGDHKTTILFMLITFYLLSAGYNVWLAQLPLVFAAVGDPLAIWIGIPAIVVTGVIFLDRKRVRFGWQLILSAVICLAVAKAVLAAIPILGGFETTRGALRNAVVSLDRLPHNVRLLFECTLNLFGANFFGRNVVDRGTAIALVHLGVLMFLIWAIWRIARVALSKLDALRLMLLSALILNLLAFLFSTTPYDLDSARYLPALTSFGPLLFGLSWYEVEISESLLWLAAPIVGAAFLIPFLWRLGSPIAELRERAGLAPSKPDDVIEYLESNHLTEGYGSYWTANILTVLSDGKVKVRQVASLNGQLVPLEWESARQWYDMKNARFLIFKDNSYDVGSEPAIRMWGSPVYTAERDGYTILVWSKPLNWGRTL
jgi:hypothetical protein